MDSVTRCPVHKPKQKVADILDEVCADICDYYCKWPEKYADYDDMLEEQCEKCPLGRLT